MTREEKRQYEDKEPVAVYPMSNSGGIEILDILYGIEDYVVCRYYGMSYHRVKINYSGERSYFRIGRFRVFLDECMKVR